MLAGELLEVERLELPQQTGQSADLEQPLFAEVAAPKFRVRQNVTREDVAVWHDVEKRADTTVRCDRRSGWRGHRATGVAARPGAPDCRLDVLRRGRPFGV